jgi:hypothetical protein
MGLVVDSYRFAAAGPSFDPETDITWHSLFWAEGTDFVAQGYTNGDAVGTWPNETGETDATATTGATFTAADADLNSQPSVATTVAANLQTAAFSSNPSYTSGVSIVVIGYVGEESNGVFFDGRVSTNRNNLWRQFTLYKIFAGSSVSSAVVATVGAKLMVAQFDGGAGSDSLVVNGTSILSGNAGAQTLTGASLATRFSKGATEASLGSWALFGVYEGDITVDGAYADFEAWVTSHYGITIA